MTDTQRRTGDGWQLRFERRFAHPPAKVWRALTEPEHLSAWYPFRIEELDLRVGGIIRYREPDGDPTDLYAEITELEPQRCLAFTEFDGETGEHRLRLTLEPEDAGCVLIFEHTFADNPWPEQTFTGWQGCLDVLAATVGRLDLGVLDHVDDAPVLRFERRLAHSPQRVWRALTDPAELAGWFPVGVDAVPEQGAPMRFVTDMPGDLAEGRVLECDPPKVYAFRWARSVLRFELAAEDDGGCLLRFSHTLSGTDTSGDLPSVARQGPGWEQCLDALAALLDDSDPPQRDGRWFLARAETYVEEYGLADGTAAPRRRQRRGAVPTRPRAGSRRRVVRVDRGGSAGHGRGGSGALHARVPGTGCRDPRRNRSMRRVRRGGRRGAVRAVRAGTDRHATPRDSDPARLGGRGARARRLAHPPGTAVRRPAR